MKRILRILSLSLVLTLVAPSTVVSQSTHGELTVHNQSGFDVTIYTNDRERSKLEANYSKTYRVPLGAIRVLARTDSKFDKEGYKDFVLSTTYPYDSWYIHNDDLN